MKNIEIVSCGICEMLVNVVGAVLLFPAAFLLPPLGTLIAKGNLKRGEICIIYITYPNGTSDSWNLMEIYKLRNLMHAMYVYFHLPVSSALEHDKLLAKTMLSEHVEDDCSKTKGKKVEFFRCRR